VSSSRSVKPVFQFLAEIPTAHKRTIRSIAWSPSGRTLATASFDSTVGVWEEVTDAAEGIDGAEHTDDEDGDVDMGSQGPTEWECVTTLEGHESECKSVGYSSDGALLASCSRDKSVWVWEGASYGPIEEHMLTLTLAQSSPIPILNVYLS
jgi:WD40 repeat protein